MSYEPRDEIYDVTLMINHPNEKLDTITNELGLQPDYKWQAGQPRATPVGTPLPGVNRDTYWAYCDRIAGHRAFFETVVELLARLEAAEEYVWGLLRSGGRVNPMIYLPGRTNIGDMIAPADLLRVGRLGKAPCADPRIPSPAALPGPGRGLSCRRSVRTSPERRAGTARREGGRSVKREPVRLSVAAAAACAVAAMPLPAGSADEASPVFGVTIPAGYRGWPMIGVAHEAGGLNDIRAVLGNDIAVRAYRDGTRPFPDGAVLARLAWAYVPSAENNAVFGQAQSFVPGAATNVQFSVKDSKRFADTNGWGYGQFEDGKPNRSAALMATCAPCHARAPGGNDFVFTHYAP